MARTLNNNTKILIFQSYITGHHIYQFQWSPCIGEELVCKMEIGNAYDKHAVSVVKNEQVVGHIPASLARYCHAALRTGAFIKVRVTGHRCNNRQNGLEVPCEYTIRGRNRLLTNVFTCIKDFNKRMNDKI